MARLLLVERANAGKAPLPELQLAAEEVKPEQPQGGAPSADVDRSGTGL